MNAKDTELRMLAVVPPDRRADIARQLAPLKADLLFLERLAEAEVAIREDDVFRHTNATNGDIYVAASELFVFGKKFAFLANAGVRGTNAQKYGYGGNTLDWEARYFVGLAFPIPIKNKIVVAPALEINQEPRYIKYVPGAHLPTDLIYAVRVSRYPDSKWTFDIGTGHLGAALEPGINIKVNNAITIAADYRF